MKISEQYRQLKPFIVDEIRAIVGSSGLGGGGTTLASVPLHGLADLSKHSGLLAESQAPWAVTQSVYIAHTANSNAHHDTATAGTLISLSGQQVSVSNGSARYQVPVTGATPFAPAWTALSSLTGNGLSFTGGLFVVGTSGLGLSTNATQVVLASSSNPGAAAAILASDGDGALQLATLKIGSSAITLNSTDNVGIRPDIQFGTNGLLAANSNLYLVADATHTLSDGAVVIAANDSKVDVGGTYYSEIARFTESGRLGIGNNAPAYNLDVTGTGRITTSLTTPIVTASADLTLQPAGDLYLSPGGLDTITSDTSSLHSASYAKTILIAGYRIGPTAVAGQFGIEAGTAEFDELRARTFVADETRVDRGQEYITKSYGVLSRPFTAPTAIDDFALIYFENSPHIAGALFSANDWVMLRWLDMSSGITLTTIWGQVNNYTNLGSGEQRWRFYLRSGSTAGLAFGKGALAVNMGASGAGYILSDAVTATSPFVQVGKWVTNPYTPANYSVLTQIGRLDGVGFTGEYGIAAGVAGFGLDDAWLSISTAGAQLNKIPLKMYSGSGVGRVQTVNIDAAGTDVWFGNGSADKRLSWDGSTLDVSGTIRATAGYIGGTTSGWAITTGQLASNNIKLVSGATGVARLEVGNGSTAGTGGGVCSRSGTTGIVLWAGQPYTDITNAPFRVTLAGSLTATDASITGSVTAGNGAVWMNSAGLGLDATTGKFTAATASWWYNSNRILSIGTTADLGAPTGAFIEALTGYVLTITAPTGITLASNTNCTGTLSVNSNAVWHAGNFTPSNYAALASPNFSGTPTISSNTIWHAGNDGSGSGLDADYLDGHDTSYFATASHNHNSTYAALAGATFTGSVTAPALYMAEQTNTPSTPSDGTQFTMYMRNDKFVIAYNRSGTPYYVQFDLRDTSGAVTWSRSTTAP